MTHKIINRYQETNIESNRKKLELSIILRTAPSLTQLKQQVVMIELLKL